MKTRQPPALIDVGANLTHDSFDADRDAVIARAREAGVSRMIVTGADLAHSRAATALVETHPGVLYASAGVHPHLAGDFSPEVARELADLLTHPAVVAAGECGLDYFRDFSPREMQREAFAAQIALAIAANKPLFLHQRDAHDDFLALLDRFSDRLPKTLVHCFTGRAGELDAYLERGFYIGITGWVCDERRGAHLPALLGRIPAGRLMLETDAPYLLPRDLIPKPATRRNEPCWLPHIATVVARARGENLEELAAHTTAAARAFFDIA
ncbi:MAG: TatD family hydrolase [Gammaproteobacteria bacterium]